MPRPKTSPLLQRSLLRINLVRNTLGTIRKGYFNYDLESVFKNNHLFDSSDKKFVKGFW
ncbi:hypothetical protein COO91_10550 (plasmid) [Nostoc flagelliforme CCNUN1]|uniref:Uncharacterized protein n=1 Tax=Nostoc flagelliforme CCNUN1 TaxID=2038116 RepID=A0A2K8T9E2_9NOSO|nr:hypothetical protein COO91_10550 [Nostoc flagelliforme CCNUN1]